MGEDQKAEYDLRDRLIELLKAADGFEDVGPINDDGLAQIGVYDETTGHDFFISVEPA